MKTTGLWVPGTDVSLEYPPLDVDALVAEWGEYLEADASSIPEVLGARATSIPDFERVASVDLCEVVRETHIGLAKFVGKQAADIEHYGAYFNTLGVKKGHEVAIATVMMNATEVEPVPEIATIADTIRRWKSDRVFTVANTATLPGCEQVTIDFLKKHMPGCFDAIVFPRNHDGSGAITKASALESAIAVASRAGVVEKVVHIDDAPHHIEAMLKHMSLLATRSFLGVIPFYKGNEIFPDKATSVPTPRAAFEVADKFLRAA